MGQLVGNTLNNMQASGAVAPVQNTQQTQLQNIMNLASNNTSPTDTGAQLPLYLALSQLGRLNQPVAQPPAQVPQQAAVAPQPVAQPPAPMAGGQAQGLANAPAFVQQMVAQLMADRAANQQASMGQPFQGVTGQPVPDNFMPRPGFGQQGFGMQGQFPQQAMQGMQNMPFNMPMRSNYFFGPMGSNFQSMQQQPFSGGFGGQQGLFGFNPYMNSRIY